MDSMIEQAQQFLCHLPDLSQPVKFGLSVVVAVVATLLSLLVWRLPRRLEDQNSPETGFDVEFPTMNRVITEKSISVSGVGMAPQHNPTLKITVTERNGDRKIFANASPPECRLRVEPNGRWRFDYVTFWAQNRYEMTFDAVLDGKRVSKKLVVEYEDP